MIFFRFLQDDALLSPLHALQEQPRVSIYFGCVGLVSMSLLLKKSRLLKRNISSYTQLMLALKIAVFAFALFYRVSVSKGYNQPISHLFQSELSCYEHGPTN